MTMGRRNVLGSLASCGTGLLLPPPPSRPPGRVEGQKNRWTGGALGCVLCYDRAERERGRDLPPLEQSISFCMFGA